MIVAGGNSTLQQGFENGFGNISWEQIGYSTLMGGITGAISSGVGGLVQAPLNSAFSGVASPVLRQSLMQGSVGTVSGFVTNGAMAKINGSSWEEALSAGGEGAIWGATFGFAGGAANGFRYAYKECLSPWTGKEIITNRASTNFVEHYNSGGRNNDLELSQQKILENTRTTIMEQRSNLKQGDNAISLKINGIPQIIKANVDNGQIRSMNLHSPDTKNPIRPHFNVIQGGNKKW